MCFVKHAEEPKKKKTIETTNQLDDETKIQKH